MLFSYLFFFDTTHFTIFSYAYFSYKLESFCLSSQTEHKFLSWPPFPCPLLIFPFTLFLYSIAIKLALGNFLAQYFVCFNLFLVLILPVCTLSFHQQESFEAKYNGPLLFYIVFTTHSSISIFFNAQHSTFLAIRSNTCIISYAHCIINYSFWRA